jgi:hypothetical protein
MFLWCRHYYEFAEGHKLAHARKPGMKKKTFKAFLSDDINRIRV